MRLPARRYTLVCEEPAISQQSATDATRRPSATARRQAGRDTPADTVRRLFAQGDISEEEMGERLDALGR